MRYFVAVVGLVITLGLCWLLDGLHVKLAFGRVLDPFHGIWQNMEGEDFDLEAELPMEGLKDKVVIRYDSLHIPHIFAQNDHDLYFAQGYVTAKDRLWQMEFQTHAAAGRLSEIISNPTTLGMDRAKRRTGMLYAAERSVKAMEADPVAKLMVEAYAEGVNAWIKSLCYENLKRRYPFSSVQNANILVFPELAAANTAYKLMSKLGGAEAIGPVLVGMNKPIHLLDTGADVRDIINVTIVAVVDAQR